MYLNHLKIVDHPIVGNIDLDLINPKTGKEYAVIAFVGENGCGKTTILNELFDYENSIYIKDKQHPYTLVEKPFDALYLRQGSLHRNALREIRKQLDGKDMFPTNSAQYVGGASPFSMRNSNTVNRITEGLKLLERLGDEEINKIFKENHISDVYCSNEISKIIDGNEHGYSITNYSSGQQEILLKIKDIRNAFAGTDCVLLDEPETSLHPRWQKEIVNILRMMVADNEGNTPQVFLATHSEKVLESLVGNDDVLIVRFYKENGIVKYETINQIDLRLPTITFAELDYVIFHISSLDYHDQLFTHIASLYNKDTISSTDRKLEKITKTVFGKDFEKYIKERNVIINKSEHITRMISTYIRDYFHHPNGITKPTEEEINLSIEFLRTLIKHFNETKATEIQ